MICNSCRENREVRDFYKDGICFKCQYKEKLKFTNVIKKICPICGNEIASFKKTYCSDDCARIMKKRHNDNRTIKAEYVNIYW